MLDPRRLREDDGDQIEADRGGLDSGTACPGSRGTALGDDFQVIHRPFGRSKLNACPRLHLNEDRPAVVLGHDINLGELRSGPVARQNSEALPLQITMGEVFAPASQGTLTPAAAA